MQDLARFFRSKPFWGIIAIWNAANALYCCLILAKHGYNTTLVDVVLISLMCVVIARHELNKQKKKQSK